MTSTKGRPDWLEQSLSARSAAGSLATPAAECGEAVPSVGQVRVLQDMDLHRSADRLGLVVAVDERLAVAHALMLSPLLEYRTSVDYVLDGASTGAPMPLIAECDLRGAVWFAQLGSCLGQCEPGLAMRLDEVGGGALPASVGLEQSRFGLPARDDRDPRWSWKLAELEALNALTAECDAWLVDGAEYPCVIDPALMHELAELATTSLTVTQAISSIADVHDAWITEDSLNSLADLLGQVNPDMQHALDRLLNHGITHFDETSAAADRHVTWVGGRERTQVASQSQPLADVIAARAAGAGRCVVGVITSQRSWGGNESPGLTPGAIDVAGDVRVQVCPIDLYSYLSEAAA